jgi:hypothetical protein
MKKLAITAAAPAKRQNRSHPGNYLSAVVNGDIAALVRLAPPKLF